MIPLHNTYTSFEIYCVSACDSVASSFIPGLLDGGRHFFILIDSVFESDEFSRNLLNVYEKARANGTKSVSR